MIKRLWPKISVLLLVGAPSSVFAQGVFESAQKTLDEMSAFKTFAYIYLGVFLLVGTTLAIEIFLVYFSARSKKTTIHHRLETKGGKFCGIAEDNLGAPIQFAKVVLYDGTEKEVDVTHTDLKGGFCFKIGRGTYSVLIDAFGYEKKIISNISIENKKTLKHFKIKKIEDIKTERLGINLALTTKYLFLILFIAAIVLTYQSNANFNLYVKLFFALCALLSLWGFISIKREKLKIIDHKGNPVKNTEFVVFNAKGDPITKLTSDSKGSITALASQGIYKFDSTRTHSFTLSMQERGFVDRTIRV